MARQAHTAVDLAEMPHVLHQATYVYDWAPPEPADTWKADAACADQWDLFFPKHQGEYLFDEAHDICATCPVYDACRAWVLDPATKPVHGFVAGMTERQRRRQRGENRRRRVIPIGDIAHG